MNMMRRIIKNAIVGITLFFENREKRGITPSLKNTRARGLGQFVVLLTLTPFIFSLNLYDFDETKKVASKYQIAPDRFEGLSYEVLVSGGYSLPKKPTLRLGKHARQYRKYKIKDPKRFCSMKFDDLAGFISIFDHFKELRRALDQPCRQYLQELRAYPRLVKRFLKQRRTNTQELKKVQQRASNFLSQKVHIKPPPPPVEVIEFSNRQLRLLLDQVVISDADINVAFDYGLSLEEIDNNDLQSDIAINDADSIAKDIKADDQDQITSQQVTSSLIMLITDKIETTTSFEALVFLPWILTCFLLIPAIIVAIKYRRLSLLIFGLLGPTLYFSQYLSSWFFGLGNIPTLEISALLIAQIGFFWFLIKGSMLSKSFAYFIGLLSFSTCLPLLQSLLSAQTLAGEQEYSLLKAQVPILIFILVCAVGRLLVKGAKENARLLRQLGWVRNIKSASRALLLWIPMAILCLPFFYLTKITIPDGVTEYLHAQHVLKYDSNYPDGFLDNGLRSIAHVADDINFAWHLTIEEHKASIYAANNNLQDANFVKTLTKHFDNIVPPTLALESPNSQAPLFGWLVNLASKETQKAAQKTYQKLRNSIRDNLADVMREKEKEIKRIAQENKTKGIETLQALKEDGADSIIENSKLTQANFWWTINYLQASHTLAMLLFILICFKSYFYVFARVSFHRDNGALVSLSNITDSDDDTHQSNIINAKGIEYQIDTNVENTYFISRRFQCQGKPPKLAFPQPFASLIARVLNKSFSMNKVDIATGDSNITCTATRGVEFFEWKLAEGEVAIFHYKNFVGMTKNLTLSTLISPKLSSLLLGSIIYSQATGPGTLILMAQGRAQIFDDKKNVVSMPPERMIAMQMNTSLHIESELDIVNIYLSTAYIKPIKGKMLVDVDNQAGVKSGAVRFLRNFLLPG